MYSGYLILAQTSSISSVPDVSLPTVFLRYIFGLAVGTLLT